MFFISDCTVYIHNDFKDFTLPIGSIILRAGGLLLNHTFANMRRPRSTSI
jgi:hypothetical protein